jgi:hypothetical protein
MNVLRIEIEIERVRQSRADRRSDRARAQLNPEVAALDRFHNGFRNTQHERSVLRGYWSIILRIVIQVAVSLQMEQSP